MAVAQVKFEYSLNTVECAGCGIVFGVPADFERRRREDHRAFYCPHGHNNHFPHETETEKAERKAAMLADQVRMEREQRERLERQLKRVQKGVCPKCNRCFTNVKRHMQTKHKES